MPKLEPKVPVGPQKGLKTISHGKNGPFENGPTPAAGRLSGHDQDRKKGQASAPFYSLSGLWYGRRKEPLFPSTVELSPKATKGEPTKISPQVPSDLVVRRPQAWKS